MAALPTAAHAVATPLNWATGEPTKGTIVSCAKNGRSGSFKISGPMTKGLRGAFEAQGSATFGPPDEFGFGGVTSLNMTFHAKGPAGEVLNGKMTGGGPPNDDQNDGACGFDEDFGYSFFINGVRDATWTADVKTRFGTYHDKGTGNVNNLSIIGSNGSADGIAPNLTSAPTGKPVNVNRPRLTGNPDVGGNLGCYGGDWIGAFAVSKYEWLRDGAVVATHFGGSAKTSDGYRVQPADATHRLTCRTTADRGFNQDPATALSNSALVNGCLVPDVRGKGLQRAKNALAAANCAVGQVTRRKGRGVPVGHVLSQNPAAGASGPKGKTVALVLRKKPS